MDTRGAEQLGLLRYSRYQMLPKPETGDRWSLQIALHVSGAARISNRT